MQSDFLGTYGLVAVHLSDISDYAGRPDLFDRFFPKIFNMFPTRFS